MMMMMWMTTKEIISPYLERKRIHIHFMTMHSDFLTKTIFYVFSFANELIDDEYIREKCRNNLPDTRKIAVNTQEIIKNIMQLSRK